MRLISLIYCKNVFIIYFTSPLILVVEIYHWERSKSHVFHRYKVNVSLSDIAVLWFYLHNWKVIRTRSRNSSISYWLFCSGLLSNLSPPPPPHTLEYICFTVYCKNMWVFILRRGFRCKNRKILVKFVF